MLKEVKHDYDKMIQSKVFVNQNAGSEKGFVEDASLLFASSSQTQDYHGQMKWLAD